MLVTDFDMAVTRQYVLIHRAAGTTTDQRCQGRQLPLNGDEMADHLDDPLVGARVLGYLLEVVVGTC